MTELPRELIEYLDRAIKSIESDIAELTDTGDTWKRYHVGYKDALADIRDGVWQPIKQQPPATATPSRQCACGKPLHSVDTGDVCPACAHKHDKSIAPF